MHKMTPGFWHVVRDGAIRIENNVGDTICTVDAQTVTQDVVNAYAISRLPEILVHTKHLMEQVRGGVFEHIDVELSPGYCAIRKIMLEIDYLDPKDGLVTGFRRQRRR